MLLLVVLLCPVNINAFVITTTKSTSLSHHRRSSSTFPSNTISTPSGSSFVSIVLPKPLLFSSEATALAQVATDDDESEVVDDEAKAETIAEVPLEQESPEAVADEKVEDAADAKQERVVLKRERHTLFVGNLPFDKTDDEIRELFGAFGKVELVNVPLDRVTGEPRGFAFVDMQSEEELEAAIAGLDGTPFGTRKIRVSKSVAKGKGDKAAASTEAATQPPRNYAEGTKKIYVGNIPFETTDEEIAAHYSQFGEVLEVYIPVDRNTGQGRGFAFVTMKDEDADRAIEETNGTEYYGRKLVVSVPLPPGEKAPPRKSSRTKIYIGNLSFYTITDTLVDAFSEFGTVHDCYIPEDSATGAARGFGFVTMDKDDADRAISELDGCEIDGRIVRVNEAQPKGK